MWVSMGSAGNEPRRCGWLPSWLFFFGMSIKVQVAWEVVAAQSSKGVCRSCLKAFASTAGKRRCISVVGDLPEASRAGGSSRSHSPVSPAGVCSPRRTAPACPWVPQGRNPGAEGDRFRGCFPDGPQRARSLGKCRGTKFQGNISEAVGKRSPDALESLLGPFWQGSE